MEVVHSGRIKLWRYDPTLPLDWRALDGSRLARGQALQWDDPDDTYVVAYAAYLDAKEAPETTPPDAAIYGACQLAEDDGPMQWEIQARLLAGQTDEQISGLCGLPADVIGAYEQVFFSVRDRKGATSHLLIRTVGEAMHVGFQDDQIRNLWCWLALAGGPVIVDVFVDALRAVRQPDQPPRLRDYLRPNTDIDPRMQGLVATSILSVSQFTAQMWMACRLRLMEADALPDPDRRAVLHEQVRSYLVASALRHLAGQPPAKPRWTARPVRAEQSAPESSQGGGVVTDPPAQQAGRAADLS